MILNTLLFPFRIVFVILRAIFFPWFVRWFFHLPWLVYMGLAAIVGYFAYEEYENYVFERFEASYQTTTAVPDATKLSQWNPATDVGEYNEVNVAGLYFTALPGGSFEIGGVERGFIPIADDQGREIKAVLVVRPGEMTDLWDYLAAQGSGDRVAVTVNGTYNTSPQWAGSINRQLNDMGIPGARDLVVIEPFMGNRAAGISARVDEALNTLIGFGAIAGLFVVLGLGKLALSRPASRAPTPPPAPATRSTRQDATKVSPGSGNMVAPNPPSAASPWGSFQPQPRTPATPTAANPTPPAPPQTGGSKSTTTPKAPGEITGPKFKSVFPGGGSGFRFKTADEIIRETFGTLSVLNRPPKYLKAPPPVVPPKQ